MYEILEVKPDQGFEVRDLWDDRRLYVRERAATRQIVAWDLIVARIGPGGDGETVFETIPYLFRAADKDGLLKGLRKAHQVFTHEFPMKRSPTSSKGWRQSFISSGWNASRCRPILSSSLVTESRLYSLK